jgi:hypothetical protein
MTSPAFVPCSQTDDQHHAQSAQLQTYHAFWGKQPFRTTTRQLRGCSGMGSGRDTCGTLAGHLRDTCGTPAGHLRDTCGTPAGHLRDTLRDTLWDTLRDTLRDTCGTPCGTPVDPFWPNSDLTSFPMPPHSISSCPIDKTLQRCLCAQRAPQMPPSSLQTHFRRVLSTLGP